MRCPNCNSDSVYDGKCNKCGLLIDTDSSLEIDRDSDGNAIEPGPNEDDDRDLYNDLED